MKRTVLIFWILVSIQLNAQKKIMVDVNGKGDHKTIQGAIKSLTDSSETPGTYIEKPKEHG